MRYEKLKVDGDTIIDEKQINIILEKNDMHWLIDSEIENADIEIIKKTLIWHGGNYYTGNAHYIIFEDGFFSANFTNGIFVKGVFTGKFITGIK